MTKKAFAVIGNPISHSLSPVLHNYWFRKYNINASYVSMNLEEKNIFEIIKKIKNKELNGLNVTLPYKQRVIPHLDELVNDAKSTNSVNTIYLDEQSKIVGENTDVYGIQAAYLKGISNIDTKKALIIGAGGVSPSVIFSLLKSKIKNITVVNRTYEKSVFLKKRFESINVLKWETLKDELINYDIIVNATSIGLKNGNNFEFDFDNVKENLIYIDTIYNPLETNNIKFLKEKKIKAFNGLEMFIYQGQKSFYLWNKINPEIDDELINLLTSELT